MSSILRAALVVLCALQPVAGWSRTAGRTTLSSAQSAYVRPALPARASSAQSARARPTLPARARRPPRSWARASLDLTHGPDLALFFLWGTPAPVALATLLAVRERAAGGAAADANLEGAGRSMLFAFPSFGLLLQRPCEPLGMPRWQRAFLMLNSWAAIGWYLYYKYLIENELRERTGDGFGGAAVVAPFALGLTAGVAGELLSGSLERSLLGELDAYSGCFWAGFAWIYLCQFLLYVRVNRLYKERGDEAPLSVWGLLLPGYNLVTGIRQIHFLARFDAEARGEEPLADPFCAEFPFTTKPELGIVELLTRPGLWFAALQSQGSA